VDYRACKSKWMQLVNGLTSEADKGDEKKVMDAKTDKI
jgi:hypothetical protein